MLNTSLKENYGTLSETINELAKAGYTLDFNAKEDCIICQKAGVTLPPEEFQVDKVYRFEGMSNPDDQAVVYAISSPGHKIKGVLVNGYGLSSDESSSRLISRLRTNHSVYDDVVHRPAAGRLLDATQLTINTGYFISQLKDEPTWNEREHNAITVFKSDKMRIVLIGLKENATMKQHKANAIISVQVLEGQIEFITGTQNETLMQGDILVLHENVLHSVTATEESFVLLTMALHS